MVNRVDKRRLLVVARRLRQPLPVFIDDAQVEPGLGELRVVPGRIVKTVRGIFDLSGTQVGNPQAVMQLGEIRFEGQRRLVAGYCRVVVLQFQECCAGQAVQRRFIGPGLEQGLCSFQ